MFWYEAYNKSSACDTAFMRMALCNTHTHPHPHPHPHTQSKLLESTQEVNTAQVQAPTWLHRQWSPFTMGWPPQRPSQQASLQDLHDRRQQHVPMWSNEYSIQP